jgi:hypothetical protein
MRKTLETNAARASAALAAHRQEFMDDQLYLSSLALFAPRAGNHDAGLLIAPRVRWILASPGGGTGSVHGATLDQTMIDKLGKDWMYAGPEAWKDVDLAWMSRLTRYDLWNLDETSIKSDPRSFRDREPESKDLWGWAKLRIAKGVHDGAVGPALGEVEDLARLCFRTERFQTQIAGLGLLELEALARQRLAVAAPSPASDPENILRIKRAIFGAIAFARLGTPNSYEDDFSRIVVGRCAALHDGLQIALQHRADLRETRPADYQHMERLLAAAPDCRLALLRQRWALSDDERMFQSDNWWDRTTMRWVPRWRRLRAALVVALGEQDWLGHYETRSLSAQH